MAEQQCLHRPAARTDARTEQDMTKGDIYYCEDCTLEITITSGCDCDGSKVTLSCCGKPMKKKEAGKKKGCCCC
jgi:hypothetical protein